MCLQAFDEPENPYLPDEVLYRQKEQFSDGVGYDWVDGLKEHAAKVWSGCACGVWCVGVGGWGGRIGGDEVVGVWRWVAGWVLVGGEAHAPGVGA